MMLLVTGASGVGKSTVRALIAEELAPEVRAVELTQIAGYPAIITRTNADIAVCDIDVKAAERQSVTVIYHSEEQALKNNPQQSCEVGKQIAAAVLMNLPPKS